MHLPEEGGTGGYQIGIEELEGERFADNNAWSFETSITEARTNVLLVDSYPRWEFRYLRNLFYGRDKSVHLQWLLLHPDRGGGPGATEHRRFRHTALRPGRRQPLAGKRGGVAQVRCHHPRRPRTGRRFPTKRGRSFPAASTSAARLLVFVAGPNHMPHALDSTAARDLLPLDPGWSRRTLFGEDDRAVPAFSNIRRPPPSGDAPRRRAQSPTSRSGPAFPALQWRHPVVSVKEGAEILLTAADDGGAADPSLRLGCGARRLRPPP